MSDNAILERPLTTNPKINDLQCKIDIINRLARDETNVSIAKDYNVDHSSISKFKKKNQTLIDQEQAKLIKLLPTATEIVTDELEANRLLTKRIRIDPYNVDPTKVSLKSELNKTIRDLWKVAGILKPQAFLNLSQDNRTQTVEISPNVLNMFSVHAVGLIQSVDTQVVEAEEVSDNAGNGDNVDNS
jgi:predicted methyltransferase